MSVHRLAKRVNSTLLATAGASPNTAGISLNDNRPSTGESKLVVSIDGTNLRTIDDGHMGAAAETSVGTSVTVATQQQVAAGNGNGADTTDDVLFTYALPANAFNAAGKTCIVEAWGKTAGNGNNKQIKLWWGTTTQTVGSAVSGGTAIASSGTVTINGKAWYLYAEIVKTGSSAQVAFGEVTSDTAVISPTVSTSLTATDTAAINITLTGASGTSGAASDVLGVSFRVTFDN